MVHVILLILKSTKRRQQFSKLSPATCIPCLRFKFKIKMAGLYISWLLGNSSFSRNNHKTRVSTTAFAPFRRIVYSINENPQQGHDAKVYKAPCVLCMCLPGGQSPPHHLHLLVFGERNNKKTHILLHISPSLTTSVTRRGALCL